MIKRIVTVFTAILLVAACATGTPFKWGQARTVKEGMTRDQIVQIMGRPHSVYAQGDIVRYVWVEVDALTFATKTFSVDLVNNVVVKVPPIPQEFN